MRKTVKILISCVLIMAFICTAGVNVFAQTDTNQEVTSKGQKQTTVTVTLGSTFKVTVPSTINIDNNSKAVLNENYTVKVEGDITGNEKVTVIPDSTFGLNQTGKDSITVAVNQDKQSFMYDEINGQNGCTATGSLTTADEITAGTWTGNLTFYINLEADLAPGLYETGTSTMKRSWDDLIADGKVTVSNGVITGSDYDTLVGDLVISSDVTKIGTWAFDSCEGLTNVTLKDGITEIDTWAFFGCINLEHINLPDGITLIAEKAFYTCTALSNVVIPDTVTTIGDCAFNCVEGITSINIPKSVAYIGESAFDGCHNLTTINVDAENPNYCSVDGVLYNKDKTVIMKYPEGKPGSTYSILPGVTKIDTGAFCYTTLNNIDIPDTVSEFGNSVFLHSERLLEITIPYGVTSISECAFSACSSSQNVSIPDTVTSINGSAFSSCTSLNDLVVPDSVTSISTYAFRDVPHVTYHGSAEDTRGNNWGALALN